MYINKTLTNDEFTILNKIAKSSKMDSWFAICQDEDKNDYVYDLDIDETYSLKEGIGLLMEGCTEYELGLLDSKETEILTNLLNELKETN